MTRDDEQPPAPRLSRREAAVKRRRGISIVWVIPIVAAAIGGVPRLQGLYRAGSDDHDQLRHRRGARGGQDQAALPRRRGRHRAERWRSRPTSSTSSSPRAWSRPRPTYLRAEHDLLDRQAAHRRRRRVRARHPAVRRLYRPRPGRGRGRARRSPAWRSRRRSAPTCPAASSC